MAKLIRTVLKFGRASKSKDEKCSRMDKKTLWTVRLTIDTGRWASVNNSVGSSSVSSYMALPSFKASIICRLKSTWLEISRVLSLVKPVMDGIGGIHSSSSEDRSSSSL